MGFYMQSKSIKRLRKCRRTSWEEGQENELLGATPKVWSIQGDTGRLDSLELKKKICMHDWRGNEKKKLRARGNCSEVTYLTEVWFLKYIVSRSWDVAQGVRGRLCQMGPELESSACRYHQLGLAVCLPVTPALVGKTGISWSSLLADGLVEKALGSGRNPISREKRVCEKPDILLWPPHACIRAAPSKRNKMKTQNFQHCRFKGLERWFDS